MTRVPELRFAGFAGEWEEKKLKDTSQIVGGGTPSTNDKDLWNGNINWFTPSEINGKRYFSKSERKISELGLNKSSAKLLDKDKTILFTSRATIGNIGLLTEDSTTNQGFQSLVVKDKYDLNFMYSLCEIIKNKALSVSTGSTFREISKSDFQNISVNTPQSTEQEKIGDLFSKIDQLIENQEKLLDQSIAFKKSMLQKMFPKKDSLVPEFRFGGFKGDWENKKINNIYSKAGSGGTPKSSVSDYYNGDIPFLSVSDISNSNGNIYETQKYITDKGLENSTAWIVPAESISLAMYASVGKVAKTKVNLATSQAFFNMIVSDNYDTEFIYQYFKKMDLFNEWRSFIITGTQPNLNANIINNYKLKIPFQKEQEKIGKFFKHLDEKIAREEELLDAYKMMKKSLLQKMFV